MARRKADDKELPPDSEILKRKSALADFAKEMTTGENPFEAPIFSKLRLVAEEIKMMKGVKYTYIQRALAEKVGLNVSTQTIRRFCHEELGWPLQERGRRVKNPSEGAERRRKKVEPNAPESDPEQPVKEKGKRSDVRSKLTIDADKFK